MRPRPLLDSMEEQEDGCQGARRGRKENEDAEEYYRRIIFENFPEKISLDIQMNTQMIGGLVRLANVIDQEL